MSLSTDDALKRWANALLACWHRVVARIHVRHGTSMPLVSISVVLSDRWHRRRLERCLHSGVQQLQRTFGAEPLALIIQERLDGGRPIRRRSCHRGSGDTVHTIQLALVHDQHRVTVDELLAALVDEVVALHTVAPTVAELDALLTNVGITPRGTAR